jgi:hypothetical protein
MTSKVGPRRAPAFPRQLVAEIAGTFFLVMAAGTTIVAEQSRPADSQRSRPFRLDARVSPNAGSQSHRHEAVVA